MTETPPSPAKSRTDFVIEIATAALLALATIATAWSGYQATRWSGVQAAEYTNATSYLLESSRWEDYGNTLYGIDNQAFTAWLAARAGGDEVAAKAIQERFRPFFKEIHAEWMRTDPFQSDTAEWTPFDLDSYQLEQDATARENDDLAEESLAAGTKANEYGDNYVLMTVIFACVLFFAGLATLFGSVGVRIAMLVVGGLIFIGAAIYTGTFPIQ